jgi:uncharacterized protein YjbI with pentapeptide repeats
MRFANLTGANLENAILISAELGAANFSDANLSNVNFSAAKLAESNFTNSTITGANFNRIQGIDSARGLKNNKTKSAGMTNWRYSYWSYPDWQSRDYD